MISKSTDPVAFDALRPRLLALLEQHRAATSDEDRARLVVRFEELFLATAWNVAKDLIENGWLPGVVSSTEQGQETRRRAIGGSDAA